MSRFKWVGIGVLLVGLAVGSFYVQARLSLPQPIRIGILHSLEKGTMAEIEKPIVDAYRLAIDEINAAGGITPVGPKIVWDIRDGESEPETFRRQAQSLIRESNVSTIFGCWTSACYRTVKEVVEAEDNLLIYPVENEGLADPGRVVYTGAAPNQQIIPAVTWLYNQGKHKFFLVGSDYVFPRCANQIAQEHIDALGGEVLGNKFVPLGGGDLAVKEIVAEITAKQNEIQVILNTINGGTNVTFFRELRAAGITPDRIPTMSLSMGEPELQRMNAKGLDLRGDYATWNYFQNIKGSTNADFVTRFQAKYGADRVTSDPIEAGYIGIYLWKQAVEDALQSKSDKEPIKPDDILKAMRRQSWHAPEGVVYVDPENLYTWKTVRVGKILADGQFQVEWESEKPIRPVPYPIYRTPEAWKAFLSDLHRGWGGKWSKE